MQSEHTPELESPEALKTKAALYRLYSSGLRDPRPQRVPSSEVAGLLARLPAASRVPPPPPEPADPEAARRDALGHNLSPDCPPYETQYGEGGSFRLTETLADLGALYGAFGLETGEGDRRPDHLPVELEFASFLCLKEALAAERGEEQGREVCRAARARFASRHLATWLPSFAAALARKAPGSYWAGLAASAAAFAFMDADDLGAKPSPRAPRPAGATEESAGCGSCTGGAHGAA